MRLQSTRIGQESFTILQILYLSIVTLYLRMYAIARKSIYVSIDFVGERFYIRVLYYL